MSATVGGVSKMRESGSLEETIVREWASWNVAHGGCALLVHDGVIGSAGDLDEVLPWASVTKIVASLAALDVVADELLDLDAPEGPPGATVRHLLGHAAGLAFDEDRAVARPGTRRIYSNVGIDQATQAAVRAAGALNAPTLVEERILGPLGMDRTILLGRPSSGLHGPTRDLARLAGELLAPRVLRAEVVDAAVTLSFPGLAGVLPGFGRQEPNDWGLGIEIRARKAPHWMPANISDEAFGHFGVAGSFLWADRTMGVAGVALTGRPFDEWAANAWPLSSQRWVEAWTSERKGL